MQIKPEVKHRECSIRAYPQVRRSASMAQLIHGQIPNFDSLQSFKKDYATLDRQSRNKKSVQKIKNLENRKKNNQQRQYLKNHQEDLILNKLRNRQNYAQQAYQKGLKKSTYTYSVPANPINGTYQKNKDGYKLAQNDKQKQINRYVRAQYVQTLSNSGYNIITGSSPNLIRDQIPAQSRQKFTKKLNSLYQRNRVSLPSQI